MGATSGRLAATGASASRRLQADVPNAFWTRSVLVASDLLSAGIAARVAVVLWTRAQPLADPAKFLQLWPLLLLIPAGYWLLGLYPAAGVSPVEELRRGTYFITAVFGSTLAALFLTRDITGASRGYLLLSWLLVVAAVPSARALVRLAFSQRGWWGLPAVVLGAGKTAEVLIEHLGANPGLDLKVLGCVDDDPLKRGSKVVGVPVVGRLVDAPRLQRIWRAKYGIVAMPGVEPHRLASIVQRHATVFPHLVVVPNAFGLTSVGVGTRDLGGFVGLYNKQNLLLRHNRILKRALDLALLLPLGLVALPVIAVCVLAIVAVSPGNPFYSQRREGRRGKPFRMWKLRTMRRDADAYLERYLEASPEARREWEQHYKLANDPRLLPVVGKFLRRSSLDELPQLANILLGQMSFVGPRPFPYYHLERFDAEFRRLRTSVVPGLTGQWQVTSRSTADLEAQERLDGYYIRNWSLWLDVYLLARTPWAVFFGKGAY